MLINSGFVDKSRCLGGHLLIVRTLCNPLTICPLDRSLFPWLCSIH